MSSESFSFCFACKKQLALVVGASIGRRDTCEHCGSDIRVCLNCKFYDPKAYNECAEPQAERVLEKNRSNFCDYFSQKLGNTGPGSKPDEKQDILKKLDDLFK